MHDTFYFVVDGYWFAILAIAGSGLAGLTELLLIARLSRWSAERRIACSSLVAPAVILCGSLGVVFLVLRKARPGDWTDVAVSALTQLGLIAMVIAGLSGLLTAWAIERWAKQ